ncbi:hypothetical protein ACGFNU_21130 [Spirillospora sp. NPDC048911]|uniref:hypothetical protein n=1 Tax=Spirillospora sp. NPDC048911 TaxID=3364527 RepID=UPI00371ABCEE
MTDTTTIKAKVIAAFPDDNLQEDEIILAPNGDIIIDRRKRHSSARPLVVGRWRQQR